MKIAYFDCFSGICGDMILGALFDIGVPFQRFQKEIQKLDLSGYHLTLKKTQYQHITATDVVIEISKEEHHRSYIDIKKLIDRSKLNRIIKQRSIHIFKRLAAAEGKIHNIKLEKVHFHEVGSVDSIIDIVGSVIGFSLLGIKKIYCSPLPLGHGFITCAHGTLPIPAPATVELLKGVPVYSIDRQQELVTPTGAAIISTLATNFGEMPLMKIESIGYGTGKIESTYPNLLRIFLGTLEPKKNNTSLWND